jgi:hypothetical protein
VSQDETDGQGDGGCKAFGRLFTPERHALEAIELSHGQREAGAVKVGSKVLR